MRKLKKLILRLFKRSNYAPVPGKELTAPWCELVNLKALVFVTVKKEWGRYVWFSKPVLGRLYGRETKEGWEITHPALKTPATAVAFQYDQTPLYTSGIRIYLPVYPKPEGAPKR
ncbi:MAG: hypothetical protein ACOZAO_04085 [Patescibacteria group bacterium]